MKIQSVTKMAAELIKKKIIMGNLRLVKNWEKRTCLNVLGSAVHHSERPFVYWKGRVLS